MLSDCVRVCLGDCVDLLTGYPFKSTGYSTESSSVRLVRGDNVIQGVLRWDDAKRWPQSGVSALQEYALYEGDVVLAMDRPWIAAGLKYAHIRQSDLPCLLVQRVARLRAKRGLDARFLRYVIGGKAFTDYVLAIQTGTAVPHISGSQIAAFEFMLPPIREQQAVGEVLGVLDDRIDLLRKTNFTLESIAQALFKTWFVDFDPVRAKQAGREPEGMDATTAALFPADFEESALGLIPKGWCVGTFGGLATLAKGTLNPLNSPSTVFEHYSLPAFDAGQLPVFETGDAIKSNKTRVPPGAVLQSKLNPHNPRVWFPSRVGEQAVCSTEFLPWLAKETASPEVVYCILTSASFESEVRTL